MNILYFLKTSYFSIISYLLEIFLFLKFFTNKHHSRNKFVFEKGDYWIKWSSIHCTSQHQYSYIDGCDFQWMTWIYRNYFIFKNAIISGIANNNIFSNNVSHAKYWDRSCFNATLSYWQYLIDQYQTLHFILSWPLWQYWLFVFFLIGRKINCQ